MCYVVARAVVGLVRQFREELHGSKTYASEGASDDGASINNFTNTQDAGVSFCCWTAEQSL